MTFPQLRTTIFFCDGKRAHVTEMNTGTKRICVLHLNQIGDLVFSLPVLQALRAACPQARIDSVVKPYLQELLEGSPLVDRIMMRGAPGDTTRGLLGRIRANRYDLLLSLSRSWECLALTMGSGARIRAGFFPPPWAWLLSARVPVVGHNCWGNNARLLDQLGVTVRKNDYVGLLPDPGPPPPGLPARFAVLSPGASRRRQTKTWEDTGWMALAGHLQADFGLTPVLVGGADCRELNGGIVSGVAGEVIDLTGVLGLRALCAVLGRAALFVGIDSGVMHLASALDVPVVGLFGPTDPAQVGPQNRRSLVVRREDLACVPCYLRACEHRSCMAGLQVAQVLEACARLLGTREQNAHAGV